LNQIIIGLGNTMRKRFGGLRLFFGKTISWIRKTGITIVIPKLS
jgi:hypothetical protein